MKYKISNIAKILGVTPDTLRYYEKEGIVKPQKDAHTNYRYYDFWDVNYLIDTLWYRSFGFSVKDIKKMTSEDTIDDLRNRFREKEQEYQETITRTQMMLHLAQSYQKYWDMIPDEIGKCGIKERSAHVHFANRFTEDFSDDPEIHNLSMEWLGHMPFARRYFEVPVDDARHKRSEDYTWGLSIPVEYIDALGVEIRPPLIYEGPCKCIHTCFKSSGKGAFSSKHIQYMIDYAKENNLKIYGNAAGILLASVIDHGALTGFFEAYLPIEPPAGFGEEDKAAGHPDDGLDEKNCRTFP